MKRYSTFPRIPELGLHTSWNLLSYSGNPFFVGGDYSSAGDRVSVLLALSTSRKKFFYQIRQYFELHVPQLFQLSSKIQVFVQQQIHLLLFLVSGIVEQIIRFVLQHLIHVHTISVSFDPLTLSQLHHFPVSFSSFLHQDRIYYYSIF